MVVDWYRAWAIDLRTGGDLAAPMAVPEIMGPSDRPSSPESPEQRTNLVGGRAVFGDPRLYVVDDGVLRVFDLRRPLRPVLVAEVVGAHRYAGIALDGDTLLATSGDEGVVRWDVR